MSNLDPAQAQQAFFDLGVHPGELHALASLSYEEACKGLAALKERARRNFRRLSLILHPDRNQGDEALTARFKVMSQVRDELEQITVSPATQTVLPSPVQPDVPPGHQRTARYPFPFPPVTVIAFEARPANVRPDAPGWVGGVGPIFVVRFR